ncbi:hypothetical protein [Streptomyces mangrovisoli]|nr:hypothetical protein [Streptomyces mangrovisoli]
MAQRMELVLTGEADSDPEEQEALTLQLRARLLELSVERVELQRSGVVPRGAKPGDVVAVGALVVTVAPIALRSVIRLLETWIRHRPVRTVSVRIGEDSLEMQGVSSAEQSRLIDVFIASHEPAARPGARNGSGPPEAVPSAQDAEEA